MQAEYEESAQAYADELNMEEEPPSIHKRNWQSGKSRHTFFEKCFCYCKLPLLLFCQRYNKFHRRSDGLKVIAVSWHGGAKSVSKTDWTPLAGRNVTIWPDNDKAGFQAGREISEKLLEAGAKEVGIINEKWLKEKFPEKWDLADAWPEKTDLEDVYSQSGGIKMTDIHAGFFCCLPYDKEQACNRSALGHIVNTYWKNHQDTVMENMDPKYAAYQRMALNKIGKQIFANFKTEEKTAKLLSEHPKVNATGEVGELLARQCSLFIATHGRAAKLSEILQMKEVITEFGKEMHDFPKGEFSKEAFETAQQKTLEALCQKSLSKEDTALEQSSYKSMMENAQEIDRSQKTEQEHAIQRENTLDHSHGHSSGLSH